MNRLFAAIVFFTRIPLWKIKDIPSEEFKHVISRWSLCGWITGGIMALTFILVNALTTVKIAVVAALIARILVTGALHEDGLADFLDGFGGGKDRDGILRIMKDSHIGSYGVLGLISYYLMSYILLTALPAQHIPLLMMIADPFSKFIASFISFRLPYARKEQDSKSQTVYADLHFSDLLISAIGGLLPLLLIPDVHYLSALILPLLVFPFFYRYIRKKIQGYTGDCCGALFLLLELAARMGFVISFYSMDRLFF